MMRKINALILSLGVLLLVGGCVDNDHSDLKAFMDEVKNRPKGRIPPLPTIKTVAPFAYQASTMRSPFEPPVVVRKIKREAGGPKVEPDLNRVKQYLEQFNITQLAMVGTLSQNNVEFGLIQDGEGVVHRVRRGDYMGSDHGRVLSVDEAAIELIEIVSDGTGGWVERARTVQLKGAE